MNQGLSIRRLPYDDPYWHVEVRASNGAIATAVDFYTHPEDLGPFASALTAFPRDLRDEARFEAGKDSDRWAYYVYLRAYVFDSVGHTALEVFTDNHRSPPGHEKVLFSIYCEAASLNRLGCKLADWIKSPHELFQWTTHEYALQSPTLNPEPRTSNPIAF